MKATISIKFIIDGTDDWGIEIESWEVEIKEESE